MPDAVYYAAHKEEHKAKVKAYKEANREKVRAWNRESARKQRAARPELREYARAYAKEYAKKNPEAVKARFKQFHADNPDYNREYLVKRAKKNPAKRLFRGTQLRSQLKNLPFDLTIEDIVVPEYCPVLGIKLEFGLAGRGRSNSAPSVDRLIPEKGYVKGNIRVISMRANWLKSNGTLNEFAQIIDYMKREGCT